MNCSYPLKDILSSGLPSKLAIFLAIACVAGVWCLLYALNAWLFSYFNFSKNFISWVFLPAIVRLLAVLLVGWAGVLGLFLGAMFTALFTSGFEHSLLVVLCFALLSAAGPLLAVMLCVWGLKLKTRLHGLTAMNLVILSMVSALFIAIPHNLAFYFFGLTSNFLDGIGPMFMGDLVGTIITLYLVRLLIPKTMDTAEPSFS